MTLFGENDARITLIILGKKMIKPQAWVFVLRRGLICAYMANKPTTWGDSDVFNSLFMESLNSLACSADVSSFFDVLAILKVCSHSYLEEIHIVSNKYLPLKYGLKENRVRKGL